MKFILLVLMCFSSVSCAQENNLKTLLEKSMAKANSAVSHRNYKNLIGSLYETHPYRKLTSEHFNKMLEESYLKVWLVRNFPNLAKETRFIDFKSNEKWAVYITETGLEDKNNLTVSTYIFGKKGNNWRPAGTSYSLVKARPGSDSAKQGRPAWKSMEDVKLTVQSDPKFQIDSLLNEYFTRLETNGIAVPAELK
jgi:hypothetical protein